MVFPLFEALRLIILAVSRSEKQIFLAAIFAGWPAALNQNLTKFAFQGLENPESMHCAALKMAKYHYLQLYITRF